MPILVNKKTTSTDAVFLFNKIEHRAVAMRVILFPTLLLSAEAGSTNIKSDVFLTSFFI